MDCVVDPMRRRHVLGWRQSLAQLVTDLCICSIDKQRLWAIARANASPTTGGLIQKRTSKGARHWHGLAGMPYGINDPFLGQ